MKLIDNPAYQAAATEWAQRRTIEADSIFARMSTDSDNAYFVVQEPDRAPASFRIDREFPRAIFRSGPLYNKLCGYSLETGSLEWEIGGIAGTSASDTFGGCFFLGCPWYWTMSCTSSPEAAKLQVKLLAIDAANGSLA